MTDDGFEVTGADVLDADRATSAAAERLGIAVGTNARVRKLVAAEHAGGLVKNVLGRELRLDQRSSSRARDSADERARRPRGS